jgi:hypothetical protein
MTGVATEFREVRSRRDPPISLFSRAKRALYQLDLPGGEIVTASNHKQFTRSTRPARHLELDR